MGYPKDLDEATAYEMAVELNKRGNSIKEGKCDYCGRPYGSTPCRFPARHNEKQARAALHQAAGILSDSPFFKISSDVF